MAAPEGLIRPVYEPAPPRERLELSGDVAFLEFERPQAPPAPVTYDERTRGLTLPLPRPGRAEVRYPPLAVRVRASGRVILRAVVTAEGIVDSIEVVSAPQPDLGFTDAAIEAVSEWIYEPGRLNGHPVPVAMTVVVDFSLD